MTRRAMKWKVDVDGDVDFRQESQFTAGQSECLRQRVEKYTQAIGERFHIDVSAVDRDGGARISHVENKCELVACGEVGESSVSRTDDRGRGWNRLTLMIQGREKNDFIGRSGLEMKTKKKGNG